MPEDYRVEVINKYSQHSHSRLEMLNFLIERGADVNHVNEVTINASTITTTTTSSTTISSFTIYLLQTTATALVISTIV